MYKQMDVFGKVVATVSGRVNKDDCCKKCSLKKSERYVPADMVKGTKLIFVGEAPGETEVMERKPFVGVTGQLLRGVVNKLQIPYSVTNVCKCRPMSPRGENRTPTSAEVKHCSPMVLDEVKDFDFIVLVGGTALSLFFPTVRLGDTVGSIIVKNGKKYFPVYHPSYIARAPEREEDWIKDLGKIEDMVLGENGGLVKKVIGKDISFKDAILDLSNSERFELDVETSSLDRFNFRMYCIGLYGNNVKNPYVFPFRQEFVNEINKLLYGKEVVIQNVLFDLGCLNKVGINLDNSIVYDTMFMAYLLDERRKNSYGQKQLAKRLFGYKYWNLIVDWLEASDEEMYSYNAEDLVVLRMLFNYFWDKLNDKQKDFCKNIVSDAFKAVSEIEDYGMFVDVDALSNIKKKVIKVIGVLQEELNQYAAINWNSPLQVGDLLMKLGAMHVRRTKTGRISLDKEAVKYMMETHEGDIYDVLSKLQHYNEMQTLLSTFLEGTFAKVGKGGRVRSSYSFVNTVTGRLSSSKPNLQNVPRDSKIKNLFVPEKGYVFVEGDCSQIELRVAAVLAREESMIKSFRDGKDLHKLTAALVTGKDESDISKEERQKAKAVNFGFLYGQGWKGFKGQAKSDYDVDMTDLEAQEWREKFFKGYSGLARWHKAVTKYVKENGYIEGPFGRIRRLYDEIKSGKDGIVEAAIRQAINAPVQGVASDITLMLMGKIFYLRNKFSNKDDVHLVATVHDEFMLEVKEEIKDEVVGWIKVAVKQVEDDLYWFDVPIIVDVKIIKKWE